MAKEIVGVFQSKQELLHEVEKLQRDGYPLQRLSVLSHENDSSIEDEYGIPVEELRRSSHKGFIDSVASAFEGATHTGETAYYDSLVGLGIEDEAAKEYEADLQNGRIILLSTSPESAENEFNG